MRRAKDDPGDGDVIQRSMVLSGGVGDRQLGWCEGRLPPRPKYSKWKVRGHEVSFPEVPYSLQLTYMEQLLKAWDEGENALLDAPTGSGKTRSSLCASLQGLIDTLREQEDTDFRDFCLPDPLPLPQPEAPLPILKADFDPASDLPAQLPSVMAEPKTEDDAGTTDPVPLNSAHRRLRDEPVKPEAMWSASINTNDRMMEITHQSERTDHQNSCQAHVPSASRFSDQGVTVVKGESTPIKRAPYFSVSELEQEFAKNKEFAKIPKMEAPSPDCCATTGRSQELGFPRPKIFYSTRTHAQLSQVIRELKRTRYRPRTTILASRRLYCINDEVNSGEGDIDIKCQDLNYGEEGCPYRKKIDRLPKSTDRDWPIQDIEEFVSSCRAQEVCPYYLTRERMPHSDLVLSPYNYIVSPIIREALKINLRGSGVIIDEAHITESACRGALSFESDLGAIKKAQRSFYWFMSAKREVMEWNSEVNKKWHSMEAALSLTRGLLTSFLPGGDNHGKLKKTGSTAREEKYEAIFSAKQTAELFGNVTPLNYSWPADREERSQNKEPMSTPRRGEMRSESKKMDYLHLASQLDVVLDRILDVSGVPKNRVKPYNMGIEAVKEVETDAEPSWRIKIGIWCLHAADAFTQVSNSARSVVLTSGTLAPLASFESELGTPFRIKLEAPHVVNMQRQVWAAACGTDPEGNQIRCTYESLKKPATQDRVGRALLQWCAQIPNGVLVFFPSFSALEQLVDRWQESGTYAALQEIKPVFNEMRGGDFNRTVSEYYRAIDRGRGAIFFGVYRGKASEGINFADGYARSVVAIGVPYPSLMDNKVQLKKKFNNLGRARTMCLCSGYEWYAQQAFKAVNQAIGRCIRHKDDFGAILLLDARYLPTAKRVDISRWISGSIDVHSNFNQMLISVQDFFRGGHGIGFPS